MAFAEKTAGRSSDRSEAVGQRRSDGVSVCDCHPSPEACRSRLSFRHAGALTQDTAQQAHPHFRRTTAHMMNMVCVLLVISGCLIPGEARSAPKPITLALEQATTLHVGDLAVLQIPSDSRYSDSGSDGPNGAWRDVLARVQPGPHSQSGLCGELT